MAIGLRWPDSGRTVTLNTAAYCVLMNGIPPGQRAYEPVGDMPETLYGSEGWGFESLRARPGHRPLPALRRGLFRAVGSHVGSQRSRYRAEQCLAHGRGDGPPVP